MFMAYTSVRTVRCSVVTVIDTNDFVIVDKVKYKSTPGLCELIFKRIPDDTIYTENDKLACKSILLATNTHRHSHKADNSILSNKGYKYKNIIALLGSDKIQIETGTMRLETKQQVKVLEKV